MLHEGYYDDYDSKILYSKPLVWMSRKQDAKLDVVVRARMWFPGARKIGSLGPASPTEILLKKQRTLRPPVLPNTQGSLLRRGQRGCKSLSGRTATRE